MDQWKPSDDGFYQTHMASDETCPPVDALPTSCRDSSHRVEPDVKDNVAARKIQKADREKLRRDRLNEQFHELGNALDPDRPKNDKATILADTIQILKELTSRVNRLKAEYASLSDESCELTQEKNELKEEKATLKADIESLNAQYQQRLRTMLPWSAVDPSAVMRLPPYPYAVPVPVPSGPIAMPPMQPYPFFPTHSAGPVPNPCPGFIPFSSPCNPQVELPPPLRASSHPQPASSRSQVSCLQDSVGRFSDHQQSSMEKHIEFSNVATELELKTPGSAPSFLSESTHKQESSSRVEKGQSSSGPLKKSSPADASSSTRCSSSYGLQDSSSNSVGDGSVDEN